MKKHIYFSIITLYILFLGSCATKPSTNEGTDSLAKSEAIPSVAYPATLQKALDAHGGMETWNSFKQLSFSWNRPEGEPKSGRSTVIDLQNRYEKISASQYEMGYDGKSYWHKAAEDFEGNLNPTFIINLEFYFFAMPFVITDPGVNHEELGMRTIGEDDYHVLKVTFDDGTGVAPKDQYLLHFNAETHRLELLLYSVTYFNSENAEKYNARKYENWQEVNGLWVPQQVVSYRWDTENNQLGDKRGGSVYTNVSFSSDVPEATLFVAPEGAVVSE